MPVNSRLRQFSRDPVATGASERRGVRRAPPPITSPSSPIGGSKPSRPALFEPARAAVQTVDDPRLRAGGQGLRQAGARGPQARRHRQRPRARAGRIDARRQPKGLHGPKCGHGPARHVARPWHAKRKPANPTRGRDLPATDKGRERSPPPPRRRFCSPCCRSPTDRSGRLRWEFPATAEGVGFEPTVPVDPGLRFSRPVHSTALPPLRPDKAKGQVFLCHIGGRFAARKDLTPFRRERARVSTVTQPALSGRRI
jgi:hypothetical protein